MENWKRDFCVTWKVFWWVLWWEMHHMCLGLYIYLYISCVCGTIYFSYIRRMGIYLALWPCQVGSWQEAGVHQGVPQWSGTHREPPPSQYVGSYEGYCFHDWNTKKKKKRKKRLVYYETFNTFQINHQIRAPSLNILFSTRAERFGEIIELRLFQPMLRLRFSMRLFFLMFCIIH